MSVTPLVSTCLISYNQAKFISEAIESILMQKVSFEIEVIIADDFSTDGTREIIIEYAQKDNRIKPILRDKNVGAGINFVEMLAAAKGKYIAYIEGDDFWSDRYKLQRQVDFMEQNSDYAICFHNTEERFENDLLKPSFLCCNTTIKETSTINDLCFSNYIPSCSVLYRNNLFHKFPDWYHKLKMGDWPLHIINAQYGKIKYLPQVMGVHRIHTRGLWSMQDPKVSFGYMIDAYDVYIDAFADNSKLVSLFKKGRSNAVRVLNELNAPLAVRIKNKIQRMIKA